MFWKYIVTYFGFLFKELGLQKKNVEDYTGMEIEQFIKIFLDMHKIHDYICGVASINSSPH